MDTTELLEVLDAAAGAVTEVLRGVEDWRARGTRPGQYELDLRADAAAVDLLVGAGVGVLSEESGRHHPERNVCVVVDPVDGSTNASRRIPWFATSLAAVDPSGLVAALVVNQATGTRYAAVRGGGATRDGSAIGVSVVEEVGDSMLLLNGHAPRHMGWRQYRALGAAALDLCLVAEGAVEAFVDLARDNLAPWDYLGAMLIVEEAGGVVFDVDGRDLLVVDHHVRRNPVAAGTATLASSLVDRLKDSGDR